MAHQSSIHLLANTNSLQPRHKQLLRRVEISNMQRLSIMPRILQQGLGDH